MTDWLTFFMQLIGCLFFGCFLECFFGCFVRDLGLLCRQNERTRQVQGPFCLLVGVLSAAAVNKMVSWHMALSSCWALLSLHHLFITTRRLSSTATVYFSSTSALLLQNEPPQRQRAQRVHAAH